MHFFLYDGHGSTRALSDSAGVIIPGQVFAYDAYGNSIGFDPANALTALLHSGELFDYTIGRHYLRGRYYDLATGTFNRLDPFPGILWNPQSLHKYLFVHGDPIQGIDPSGLFNQAFGLAVENAIQTIWKIEHPSHIEGVDVVFGRWSKIYGAYRAKPDILNYKDWTYNEIKPLTVSGAGAAISQMLLRKAQFDSIGYMPDTQWHRIPTLMIVGSEPTLFFNVGGVLFYTDMLHLTIEFTAALSLRTAYAFARSPAGWQSLIAAFERIPALTGVKVGADNQRGQGILAGALLIGVLAGI